MRLIDADALIRDIDGDLLDGIAEARAIEKIEDAPTICCGSGSVPCVRCYHDHSGDSC